MEVEEECIFHMHLLNKAKNKFSDDFINDFLNETNFEFEILQPNRHFHDRYVIIDYKTDNETIYHCGSSSKDSGLSVTTIMKIESPEVYHTIIDELLM